MKNINGGVFTGERALFSSTDLEIQNATFRDGESPLKESKNIKLYNCTFSWKYPLWYCQGVEVYNGKLDATARSGIWYTKGIKMHDCVINAPKTFRRSEGISLVNVELTDAQETMWNCSHITLERVNIRGDYFGFGSSDISCSDINVDGNYLFDGGKKIVVKNSRLISKDAFWNC